mgnify:CR=1 FL=1
MTPKQNKSWQKEKITKKQREKLLNVIDGRIYLVKSELRRLTDLLVMDLEATKRFIETL